MDLAISWRPSRTFISDLAVGKDHKTLLATSGDGRLFVMDRRGKKDVHQSDPNESELLSVGLVKVRCDNIGAKTYHCQLLLKTKKIFD